MNNNGNLESEKKCYRAYCPVHDWEGMSQYDKADAEKDLQAHKELLPDESHKDSKVREVKC